MEYKNVPDIKTGYEFRAWLEAHHGTETECYLELKRGRTVTHK